MKPLPTVTFLIENFQYLDKVEEYLKEFNIQRPVKPKKPVFSHRTQTSEELFLFAKDTEKYEKAILEFDVLYKVYSDRRVEIHNLIIEYIKEASGFMSNVPEKYKSKVLSFAMNQKDNNNELYNILSELVEIFE